MFSGGAALFKSGGVTTHDGHETGIISGQGRGIVLRGRQCSYGQSLPILPFILSNKLLFASLALFFILVQRGSTTQQELLFPIRPLRSYTDARQSPNNRQTPTRSSSVPEQVAREPTAQDHLCPSVLISLAKREKHGAEDMKKTQRPVSLHRCRPSSGLDTHTHSVRALFSPTNLHHWLIYPHSLTHSLTHLLRSSGSALD